ncbi:MAG TPA: hypothetical protein EYN66_11145 [Myxococcales bacterium]|nr:hypothetical protein [Myxococcales bacterium]
MLLALGCGGNDDPGTSIDLVDATGSGDGSSTAGDGSGTAGDGSGTAGDGSTSGSDGVVTDGGSTTGSDGMVDGEPPGKSNCGDSNCEPGEDAINCAQDCDGPGPGKCWLDKCEDEYIECQEDPSCLGLFECRKECKGAPGCWADCMAKASDESLEKYSELITCGKEENCNNSNPPPDSCGNGKCEDWENPKNCPKDCSTTNDPTWDCLLKSCGKQLETCLGNDQCADTVDCLDNCDGSEICEGQCIQGGNDLFWKLVDCGEAKGCFDNEPVPDNCGNGTCEQNENSNNCPQDCGSDPNDCIMQYCEKVASSCLNNSACTEMLQCFQNCGSNQNCAENCYFAAPPNAQKIYQEIIACGQENGCFPGSNAVCGNGNCEPGENPDNCPKDCDSGPFVGSCEGKCGTWVDGAPCQCIEKCADLGNCCSDYAKLCSDVPPKPVCGNGKCEMGENPDNCPKDCGDVPPKPACGNGKCEMGENPDNCPKDCGDVPPKPACGNEKCEMDENFDNCPEDCAVGPPNNSCAGQCGEWNDQWSCNCDDQCMEFTDCCDDYKKLCVDTPPPPTVDPAACIYAKCKAQMSQCTTDYNCTLGLQCLDNCNGDYACVTNCVKTTKGAESQNLLENVVFCGVDEQCLVKDATNPPSSVCGNAQCEDGENADNCPKDCSDEPPPGPDDPAKAKVLECLQSNCDEYAQCEKIDACMSVVDCFIGCKGSFFCGVQCVQASNSNQQLSSELGLCGQQNGCFN